MANREIKFVPAYEAGLPDADASELRGLAAEIQAGLRSIRTRLYEVGAHLNRAKGIVPHGRFGAWVEANFAEQYGLSERTAQKWMRIADTFKSAVTADLREAGLTIDAIDQLASAPVPVRTAIVQKAQAGEPVTPAEVRAAVAPARPPPAATNDAQGERGTTPATAPAPPAKGGAKPTPTTKPPPAAPAPEKPAAESKPAKSAVTADLAVLDQTGWPIPPRLRPALVEGRERATAFLSTVTAMSRAAGELTNGTGGEFMDGQELKDLVGNVRRYVTGTTPFAVCRHCGGRGCKACDKHGWLPKLRFEQTTPKELMDLKPPAAGGKGAA